MGEGDVAAGIEFIYHMRNHSQDIAIATAYGLGVFTIVLWIKSKFKQESNMREWINNRIDERTSWDGAALIAVGVIILIAGPFAKIAAYAAIAYGAWTIWKSE